MPTVGGIIGLQWLAQNATRRYPLMDEATGKDITGDFSLPDDLLVDMLLPVNAADEYDPSRFHLYELAVFGHGVLLTFAHGGVYAGGTWTTTPTVVGSVSVSAASHQRNQTYFLAGVGDFVGTLGRVTIGSLSNVMQVAGAYRFDSNSAALLPTCIRPDIRGVSSLAIAAGTGSNTQLTGDLRLVAGSNIRLRLVDSSTIRIDAIRGEGLNEACDCAGERVLSSPIRRINGISVSADGNFTLTGNECVTLTPIANGLRIEDTCSKPCCGSNEIEQVANDLKNLNLDVRTMHGTQRQLETQLMNLSALKAAIEASGIIVS
jgi:hypothetical protein